METSRVSCPDCGGVFKLKDEFRGKQVDCPKCGTPFVIPAEGSTGVPVSSEAAAAESATADASGQDDASFEVSCPACHLVYEVPQEYRGEQGECSGCDAIFLIPETGSEGILIEEEADAEPAIEEEAAVADTPAASDEAAPETAPAPASIEVTASGIKRGTLSSKEKQSRTVRLSRSSLIENTMKPSLEPAPAPAGGQRAGRVSSSGGITYGPLADTAEMERESAGVTPESSDAESEGEVSLSVMSAEFPQPEPTTETSAKGGGEEEAIPRRPGLEVAVPEWVGALNLQPDEEMVECVESQTAPGAGEVLLTLAPVVLIVPAALLAGVIPPLASMLICVVLGIAAWWAGCAKTFRTGNRKVLVLTTRRAILVTETESLQVSTVELE